jgi:hypothetical protein
MSSDEKLGLRWPDILYAYLRYGWVEWLAVLAVSSASIAWCGVNFLSLAARGSVFVIGGRYGSPDHWAKFEVEPLWVIAWSTIDLIWLLASSFGFVAAALWLGRQIGKHFRSS